MDRHMCQQRADAALAADVWQVARQAVAEVDHRMNAMRRCQPAGKLDARSEGHVAAEDAAAERAGDVHLITNHRALTCDRLHAGAAPKERDSHDQLPVPRAGISSNDLATECSSGLANTRVQLLN